MNFISWDHQLVPFFTITVIFWDLQRGTWSEGVFFKSTIFNMFWYDGPRLSSINSCVFVSCGKTCQAIVLVNSWQYHRPADMDVNRMNQRLSSILWFCFLRLQTVTLCDFEVMRSWTCFNLNLVQFHLFLGISNFQHGLMVSTRLQTNQIPEVESCCFQTTRSKMWKGPPSKCHVMSMSCPCHVHVMSMSSPCHVHVMSMRPAQQLFLLLSEAQKVCFVKWKSPFLWNDSFFQEMEKASFVRLKTSLLWNEKGLVCDSEMVEASFVRWNGRALFYQMPEACGVIEKVLFGETTRVKRTGPVYRDLFFISPWWNPAGVLSMPLVEEDSCNR